MSRCRAMVATLLAILLGALLVSSLGCAPIDQQMRSSVKASRCQVAARLGKSWLANDLPERLATGRTPKKLRATAAMHAAVVRQMLAALSCAAIDRNTIAALQSYREIAAKLVKALPKSYRAELAKEKKRLDDHTLQHEAAMHYFKVARPSGKASRFREHRRRYPKSRYLKEAMKSEMEMAWHDVATRPSYRKTVAFAAQYKDVPSAARSIRALWGRTAAAEIFVLEALSPPTIKQLVKWLRRYGELAGGGELTRATLLLHRSVDAQVAELRRTRHAGDLIAFVEATRGIELPQRLDGVQQWLKLRHMLVSRELREVTWERAMERGSQQTFADFAALWEGDPAAVEQVAQVRAALDVHAAWASLGPHPAVSEVAVFLAKYATRLGVGATAKLQGCPTVASALRRSAQLARGDECTLQAIVRLCLDSTWCDMRSAAVQQVVGELARAASVGNRRKRRRRRGRRIKAAVSKRCRHVRLTGG